MRGLGGGALLALFEQHLQGLPEAVAASPTGATNHEQAPRFEGPLGVIQAGSAELGVIDQLLFPEKTPLPEKTVGESHEPEEKAHLGTAQAVENSRVPEGVVDGGEARSQNTFDGAIGFWSRLMTIAVVHPNFTSVLHDFLP
jgi:hypothetical protein